MPDCRSFGTSRRRRRSRCLQIAQVHYADSDFRAPPESASPTCPDWRNIFPLLRSPTWQSDSRLHSFQSLFDPRGEQILPRHAVPRLQSGSFCYEFLGFLDRVVSTDWRRHDESVTLRYYSLHIVGSDMGMPDGYPAFLAGRHHMVHGILHHRMVVLSRITQRLAQVAFADQDAPNTRDC